jgi:hypothetical protein
MSDITELLNSVAPTGDEPTAATVEADIARGRTALVRVHRQRTIRRSMLAGGSLVVAAAVVVTAVQLSGGSSSPAHHTAQNNGRVVNHVGPKPNQKSHPKTKPSIKLVDYTGKQLAGFTVDEVPDGWQLSTSTPYALLITKAGSTDNDPSAFEGKLAVLTSSVDEHGLGKGDHVTVNGQPGVVSDQGSDGIMLSYNDPNGFGVDIQAPSDLGWTDSQIVSFADGVHVTGNAVHSHG